MQPVPPPPAAYTPPVHHHGEPLGTHVGPVRAWVARMPLSTRLVSLVMAILLLGLGAASLLTTTLLKTYLINQVDRDLSTTYSTIAGQILNDRGQGNDLLPSDYYLALRELDGTVTPWVQSDTAINRGVPDLSKYLVNLADTAARPPSDPFTTDAVITETKWRVLVRDVSTTEGALVGEIFVALPLTDSLAIVAQIQRVLFLSGLAITLCGGIAGAVAVRQSLRPLANIERTAAAIAKGDLTRRVPPAPPTTEVGNLAQSLNTMLSQIEQGFADREASEMRMRRFVSDASHELRTPLAAIRGYGELYRMGALPDKDALDDTMRRIENSATRMGNLVEDLLHLARLDEGRNLRFEPVDLAVLAVDSASDLHALDPSRKVRVLGLDGKSAVASTTALADEDRLRQVLANLIGNVARHTDQGTPVEILVGSNDSGTSAVLEVIDHGRGILPEHREKIFERFYRVDSSRNRASGGSGLGLAIVSAILAAHGGSATILDTEGGGVTVRIELPTPPVGSGPQDPAI